MNFLQRSLYAKVVALLAIPFFLQLCMFSYCRMLIDSLHDLEMRQARSREIIGETNWIHGEISNAIVGRVGEIFVHSHNKFRPLRENSIRALNPAFARLRANFRDDPVQLGRVNRWEKLCSDLRQRLEETKQGETAGDLMNQPEVSAILSELPQIRHEILAEERLKDAAATKELPAVQLSLAQQMNYLIVLDIFTALVLIYLFIRNIAARLSVVSENSLRLVRRQPLLPPMGGEDEISRLDEVFHIVARTLSEMTRRDREIADNILDVICSIDVDGRFTEVNQASMAMWGYDADELLGMRVAQIVDEETRATTLAAINKARAEGSKAKFENRVICKDGTIRDMLWVCSFSDDRMFAAVHDISERKRAEQMKEEFYAMVSHDVRTPLTGISLFLESLLAGIYGDASERMKNMALGSTRAVNQVMTLINSLLEMQKLESGTVELAYESVDLDALINESVDTVSQMAIAQELKIEHPAIGITIEADKQKLSQVLTNLISNAVKYSPSGGVIVIDGRIDGDYVEVSVKDEGRGVPSEKQALIFEPFKQAAKEDNNRGTGLGLSICKTIVECHGGTIGVESEPQRGSRFWVKLPISGKVIRLKERENAEMKVGN